MYNSPSPFSAARRTPRGSSLRFRRHELKVIACKAGDAMLGRMFSRRLGRGSQPIVTSSCANGFSPGLARVAFPSSNGKAHGGILWVGIERKFCATNQHSIDKKECEYVKTVDTQTKHAEKWLWEASGLVRRQSSIMG
jgi:hypothetical protein